MPCARKPAAAVHAAQASGTTSARRPYRRARTSHTRRRAGRAAHLGVAQREAEAVIRGRPVERVEAGRSQEPQQVRRAEPRSQRHRRHVFRAGERSPREQRAAKPAVVVPRRVYSTPSCAVGKNHNPEQPDRRRCERKRERPSERLAADGRRRRGDRHRVASGPTNAMISSTPIPRPIPTSHLRAPMDIDTADRVVVPSQRGG
jgi:hypothetical protein